MITCHLDYTIDPERLQEFEEYGRMWIRLIGKFGGRHHGYFLPSEGASDKAIALFSFPTLAKYETYRRLAAEDPECADAVAFAKRNGCIVRYERTFFRPVE
jgi:hypothetical protein